MSTVASTQTVSLLASMLGVNQNTDNNGVNATSIEGTDISASSSVNVAEAVGLNSSELSHILVLKDRLEGGSHLLSMVSINENSLTTVGGFLTQIQAKLAEANSLDVNSVHFPRYFEQFQK